MFDSIRVAIQNHRKVSPPQELLDFGTMMFDRAVEYRKGCPEFAELEAEDSPDYKCPSGYHPNMLHSLLYPEGGIMDSHQDAIAGWVLSLSIGSSALFSFGPKKKVSRMIKTHRYSTILFMKHNPFRVD